MFTNWNSTGLSGNNNKGFTLLEILIAVFILAVVLSTIYAAYRGTFRIIADTEKEGEIYGMATNTMNRILKDLGAVAMSNGAFKFVTRPSLAAGADFTDLTFISRAHLPFREGESPGALAEIAYYVDQGGEEDSYRLLRRDRLSVETVDEGDNRQRGFVICEGLYSLKYRFIDAAGNEHLSWDSVDGVEGERNKVPAMAVLELRLVNPQDKERPYLFTTSVFLPGGTAVQATP